MDANFLKFKRKVWVDIIIKCAVIGLAVGFLAVNATLLPCKLFGIKLFWLLYVLIAVAGTALGGGLAFVFLRTNDKKIAKRLDKELELQERVQTAYEFNGKAGVMLDMQRTNASTTLENYPARSLPFKNIAIIALCALIAVTGLVAIPVISFTVPATFAKEEDEKPYVEPPRDISEWEWEALDDLIEYVQNTKKAEQKVKVGMLTQLRGLKAVLLRGVSQSSLVGFVQNTVTEIRNVVKDANDQAPEAQQALNSEDEAYIINKLYEIFGLAKEQDPTTPPDPGKDDENDGNNGSTGGPGSLDVINTPFFDPDKANSVDENGDYLSGEVKCGEARTKYYMEVQKALAEGTISREEWEFIMLSYFADLNIKDEN